MTYTVSVPGANITLTADAQRWSEGKLSFADKDGKLVAQFVTWNYWYQQEQTATKIEPATAAV